MARIYSGKKGKSSSHRPPSKTAPKWVEYKKEDVEKLIAELSKQKHSSAKIGGVLRDSYGITSAKLVAKNTISKVMQKHGDYPEIPEDLLFLLKKAVNLRSHLESRKKDKHSRRGLNNLESQIRRLSKYYVRKGKLDKKWKYNAEQARLIIQKW